MNFESFLLLTADVSPARGCTVHSRVLQEDTEGESDI